MKAEARIRTIVVDDEPVARQGLRVLLEADPQIEVVGTATDGGEAVKAIRAIAPDLVFLDVQMPEVDGFGVIERVGPNRMPAVVFVTAWDRYALRAFDVHALDYLVKPFDDDRFRKALERAKTHVREGRLREASNRLLELLQGLGRGNAPGSEGAPGAARATRAVGSPGGARVEGGGGRPRGIGSQIAIRSGGRVVFLAPDEIDWVEAADDHVRLHVGERWYVVRETLSSVESRMDPERFVRIHRSTVVNLARIREIRPSPSGDQTVVLRDGTELRLARSHRALLEARNRIAPVMQALTASAPLQPARRTATGRR